MSAFMCVFSFLLSLKLGRLTTQHLFCGQCILLLTSYEEVPLGAVLLWSSSHRRLFFLIFMRVKLISLSMFLVALSLFLLCHKIEGKVSLAAPFFSIVMFTYGSVHLCYVTDIF